MNEILEIAKEKSENGKRITILLAERNHYQEQLKNLSDNKYFTSSQITIDYINKGGSISSIINKSQMKSPLNSTQLKQLGKDIVNDLNKFDLRCISELRNISICHFKLKIDIFDNLITHLI